MRISDWSSDVCSSDLHRALSERAPPRDIDFGGFEILPGVKAVNARAGDQRPGEAARRVVDLFAVVEVGEFFVAALLPDLLEVAELAHPAGDRVVDGQDMRPAAIESGRASCREGVCQYV